MKIVKAMAALFNKTLCALRRAKRSEKCAAERVRQAELHLVKEREAALNCLNNEEKSLAGALACEIFTELRREADYAKDVKRNDDELEAELQLLMRAMEIAQRHAQQNLEKLKSKCDAANQAGEERKAALLAALEELEKAKTALQQPICV